MSSTLDGEASRPAPALTWEEAVKQRDQSRAERERFDRVLKQELAIQSAAMSKKEMPSCITLFDACVRCYALFPQLTNVYRHGGLSDCAEKTDDWKACLMLRGLDADEKYKAWIHRRAEVAAHKRLSKQSTEEVWSLRVGPNGIVIDPQHASEDFPNPGHAA